MKIEAYNLCEKINNTSDEADCEQEGCKNGCKWKNIHNYFLISPQRPQRSWMEEKTLAFSYKCLPLKTANQLGWQISCPIDFSCTWGGDFLPESLKIEYKDTGDKDLDFENKKIIDFHIVESHFGHGILTFNIPYIFRTPKKKALYIRGPTNWYKEYCQYLDAVIETDWINMKFAYSIKIKKPNQVINFSKGEPICSFIPLDLESLSHTTVVQKGAEKNRFLLRKYKDFIKQRAERMGNEPINDLQYFNGGFNSVFDKNKEIGCPFLHFKSLNLKTNNNFGLKEQVDFIKQKIKQKVIFIKNLFLNIIYRLKNIK